MAAEDALNKLHQYTKDHQKQTTELKYTEQELQQYVSRLEKSARSLQNQIKQHEASVDKLQQYAPNTALVGQAKGTRERLHQLRAARNAYRSLLSQDPPLPTAESPLPALLALRCTLNTIHQSKKTIVGTQEVLIDKQKDSQLVFELSEDAKYLSHGLQDRMDKLYVEEGEQSMRRPAEIASNLVIEQQKRRSFSRAELRSLVKAFNAFVNDHLAIMLAAEDLGGPIVGDDLELEEQTLEFGFTQQGKPKKPGQKTDALEKKRLVRNSQIWGDEYVRDRVGKPIGEIDAAGACFRDLTEDLLNAFGAKDETNTYVSIVKENAAVRFLIRANVVQFHPDNAKRVRLC